MAAAAARWAPVVGLLGLLLLPFAPAPAGAATPARSPPSSASSAVFLLSGDVYPTGHYYVTMNIGDPAKPYFLDVDTGSDLTWLQCDAPCQSCNKVPHPLYRPTKNKLVPCANSICTALHSGSSPNKKCTTQQQCDYQIKYTDKASSLAVDMTNKWGKMVQHQQQQTACLGLGGDRNYYSPGSATLYFDRRSLSTKPMEVVFDSGSTYTYFSAQPYQATISAIKGSLSKSLKQVSDPSLPLCWKGQKAFKSVSDVKKDFKSLQFIFGKNAVMEIPPENYLIVTKNGNVCLGILDGSAAKLSFSIIGDITMQDQMVIYDNEKAQLGWIRGSCSRSPKSIMSSFP
uniref:Peptidase A1 domain-containing protein n=1 Tax=Oryza nivara TaxID=4536 RepID=A0A0E0IZ43_ORYNI